MDDNYGFTQANILAFQGKGKELRELLIKTGNSCTLVNHEDIDGNGALHEAAMFGNTKCLEILIGAGAELDKQNNEGETAAHLAATYGRTECLKILIEAGAQVNLCDNNLRTVPRIAFEKGLTGYFPIMERFMGIQPNKGRHLWQARALEGRGTGPER